MDQRESLPIERTEVERFAQKQIRKNVIPIKKDGRALSAKNCFDVVVTEGIFTITLVPYNEYPVSHPLIASMEHQQQKFIANKRWKSTNG